MKTITRKFIFLLVLLFAFSLSSMSANHWSFGGGNTGLAQWQLWIYGATLPDDATSLEANDEIAIYDGSTMVGWIKLTVTPSEANWTSSCLIAYSKLADGSNGYTSGNTPTIKVWDASGATEYVVDNVTFHPNWYQSHGTNTFPSTWGYSYVSLQTAEIAKGTLSGTITDGANPITGVTVTIGTYTGTTIANGTYSIANVPTGTYDVTAVKSGYNTGYASSVTISDGATTTQNFTMTTWSQHYAFGGGNPFDSVWTIYIESAKFNGTDMQAQDEIIILDGATTVGVFVFTQVATSSNKYENDLIAFAGLDDGSNGWDAGNSYTFKGWDNSASTEFTNTATATLSSSGEYTGSTFPNNDDTWSILTIELTTNPGSITGTHNVNGATVTATNTSTSETYTATVSGGSYTITNVLVGSYDITSTATGYVDYTDGSNPHSVSSGGTTTVNITMTQLGWLTGTINVNGATVTATNTTTSTTYTTTSAAGSYTISNLPAGGYYVKAEALGYTTIMSNPASYSVSNGSGTTVNITMSALGSVTQNINLSSGYQFISRNVQPTNVDMDNMLRIADDITPDLDFVRNTDGQTYDYVGGSWTNNIGDWEKEEGYLFDMDGADVLTITGYQIDQSLTPIDLTATTQFIAYIPTFSMDIETAFADILDNLDWAKNSAGEKLRKIGGVWVDNIGDIGPGEGIQVKMTGTDRLVYRSTPPPTPPRGNNETLELNHFIFTGGNAAANMFRMYVDPNEFEVGDEIAAFDGYKLVGAMVVQSMDDIWDNDLNIFSVTNYGPGYQVGNPIMLKAWDASEQKEYTLYYERSNPYGAAYMGDTYPSGDNKYSVATVYKSAYGIDEDLASFVKIYPNPAQDVVNVYAPIPVERIRVYDLLGKRVLDKKFNQEFIRINTENLHKGVYIIQLETGEGILNQKLTIQ